MATVSEELSSGFFCHNCHGQVFVNLIVSLFFVCKLVCLMC